MCEWLRNANHAIICEKTFPWLVNPKTNHNLYLDIYINDMKLAIEFDGPTHFKIVKKYGMTKGDLVDQQYRDKLKDKLCLSHGITVVRFCSGERITEKMFWERLLKQNHNRRINHWK